MKSGRGAGDNDTTERICVGTLACVGTLVCVGTLERRPDHASGTLASNTKKARQRLAARPKLAQREGRGDVEHEKDVARIYVVIDEAHHMAALEFVTQVYWEQLSDGRHLV